MKALPNLLNVTRSLRLLCLLRSTRVTGTEVSTVSTVSLVCALLIFAGMTTAASAQVTVGGKTPPVNEYYNRVQAGEE